MNIKVKLVAILFLFLFICFAPSVEAERIINGDESVSVRIENRINSRETTKEEVKVRIEASKRERIRSLHGKIITRIESLVDRLEKIIQRIKNRLTQIKSDNPEINTSDIEKKISESELKVKDIKNILGKLNEDLELVMQSDKPFEALLNLKNDLEKIKELSREVHLNLVHIIGDIKGLRVGNN